MLELATTVVNVYHGEYSVYIGRKGKGHDGYFGNPYRIGALCSGCGQVHSTGGSTLSCYSNYFIERLLNDDEFAHRITELKGHSLGCFCRPRAGFAGRLMCHGQVIVGAIEGVDPHLVP